ncbi:MAG: NTP transferase domain-containing protein [Armatimonadetes bacterium]|nr:NTP transferase domain-containing protein [Armatimonadota bacterium]NIO75138.1 NTP transferase domain-containing protein [Armatimonadota bacterium]NIO95762.1 NTP transferase domain-containing protein [Armatimonadota bacterium]
MKVLILAGGFGTRLYPLTWARPKSIVPLANTPFLERMLTWLRRHGLMDVILAVNHLPEMIRDCFGDGSSFGVNLEFLLEDIPLGSGGAIRNAQHLLGEETFLVLNGDILTDLNLEKMIQFHRTRKAQMTISLARVEDPSGYGVVDMEADGRLRRFVEKPAPEEAPSNYINAGAWLFEPETLDKMPVKGTPFSVEREFWPKCLEEGMPMFGYPEDCYWMDIGTVNRYLEAHRDLLAGRIQVSIKEPEISPRIWQGKGAQVHPGATLIAPVIIGAGATVGPDAEISDTVIGPGSIIEAGAVVCKSVLWEKVQVGQGARITNSVIGARQKIDPKRILDDTAVEELGARSPEE